MMINLKNRLKLLAGGVLITAIPTVEAVDFNGIFIAKNSCPLYSSKNKLTNPGNLYTHSNQTYSIKEANKIPADWLRIVVPELVEPNNLRWVEASCGNSIGSIIKEDLTT